MKLKNTALLAALLLAVPGCMLIPKYARPNPALPSQFPGRVVSNQTHASDIACTNFFNDPRLLRLLELAQNNNRDYRVAMLKVEQSRAQYRITRSSLLPTLDANGSYTRSQTSLSGFPSGADGGTSFAASQWSVNAGLTAYELDLFGRVRSLGQQALENFFATAEAQHSARIALVAEVAQQYFAWRQAEEQRQLAQQTLTTVQASYDLNKATFQAGASNELDLRTAEGQVQTAKINLLSYERACTQAANYLTLLVGQTLPADLPAAPSFKATNLLADIPSGLPSQLLERRPDILQAEHTLKAANANIGAARAAFFPSLSLTASAGTSSTELSQLFGSGTGVWSFSPQITLPLFTGGRNRANLDAAELGKRIEVANYEKAIQTAFREVADALVATGSYIQQGNEQEKLALAQQRRYELALARYRQGEDSYLNALSAQQDLYSSQQGLLQTQFNKLTSQITLYKALGGGWK